MADIATLTVENYGCCHWCGRDLHGATDWRREICSLCYLEGRPAAGEEGFDA